MSEWIKCSERMPDPWSDVLITDGSDVRMMWWNLERWDSWDNRLDYALSEDVVTHWMPLPEPLKE